MLTLRIIIIVACLAFGLFVGTQVASRKLLLRYSLLWLTLAFCVLLGAVFPDAVTFLSEVFGFDIPSNFVFFVGLFFLLAICLSLSVVVSKQSMRIKNLVQNLALLDSDERQNRGLISKNEK